MFLVIVSIAPESRVLIFSGVSGLQGQQLLESQLKHLIVDLLSKGAVVGV